MEIIYTLPQIHRGDDRINWRFPEGRLTTQSLYRLFCPPGPKVGWSSLLSGSLKIPRHNFILWLAIQEKLPTTDKAWMTHLGGCILCDEGTAETHTHMFFRCQYNRRCLAAVRQHVRFSWPNREWKRDVEWASRSGGESISLILLIEPYLVHAYTTSGERGTWDALNTPNGRNVY